jgi:NagD protein
MKGLNTMEKLRNKKAFICDMDGVIYHGNRLLPGVKAFVDWLKTNEKQFLFLSGVTSREDLQRFAYHPRYILEGVIDIPG